VLSLRLRDADNATIADLHEKNRQLAEAYEELKAAQAQLIEKEKLEQELRTARWIQQSILPGALPRLRGFDFGVRMEPARAVGGDLFDFIPLGRGHVGIVVGDVSDKGVPAAIFMALTRSLLRAEASRASAAAVVLRRVNHLLLDMNEAGMFVTMLYGVLDGQQGRLAYARAGHELPLLFSPAADPYLPAHSPGNPLGIFDTPVLDEGELALSSGNTLLLYTDGATDIADPSGVPFGLERLQAVAQTAVRSGASAQGLCDRVWQALGEFQAGSPQADDVIVLAVRAL
jgi:serine phosphatase RsbU (regulator of sigma subunit)